METFLVKLAIAVVPLITFVIVGTLLDLHARKRKVMARRAHWVHRHRSTLKWGAAGVMNR